MTLDLHLASQTYDVTVEETHTGTPVGSLSDVGTVYGQTVTDYSTLVFGTITKAWMGQHTFDNVIVEAAQSQIPGDANGDGCVDDLDLTALAVNWQQGCGGGGGLAAANVPEPTTVSLLVLASVALLRRRK